MADQREKWNLQLAQIEIDITELKENYIKKHLKDNTPKEIVKKEEFKYEVLSYPDDFKQLLNFFFERKMIY